MAKRKKSRMDRRKYSLISLCVVWLSLGFGSGSLALPSPDGEMDVTAFLDRLAVRISSYAPMDRWSATVRSRVERMDKNWRPKKTTLITKTVYVDGTERREEILEASEVKKGETKDVTAEYIEETRKEAEKARKRREKGEDGGGRGRRELTRSQLFPFDEEERADFVFSVKEDTDGEGQPVYILESRSRIKSEDIYTGTYTIARDSLDMLRAQLEPTKKPAVLKTIVLAFEFQVLPGDHLALRRTWFKMHLNILIKVVRLEAEEEYIDIKVIE
jgi:hypothetical protein